MEITIRAGLPGDLAALDAGLRALSAALGDAHRAGREDLARALFGPAPLAQAVVAEGGAGIAGLAMYGPLYSTVRGMAGAYVSDLWVADALRGHGVGARLLAGVRDAACAAWGAGFVRLAVYDGTPRARAFYDRLGFAADTGQTYMTISGAPLAALGTAQGDRG